MTLRDYFAAHAPITLADAVEHLGERKSTYGGAIATLAQMRTAYADAMLKAREP